MRTTHHTVTEPIYGDPRPMSEAPRNGMEILLLMKWAIVIARWVSQEWQSHEGRIGDDRCIGWWPLPKVEK